MPSRTINLFCAGFFFVSMSMKLAYPLFSELTSAYAIEQMTGTTAQRTTRSFVVQSACKTFTSPTLYTTAFEYLEEMRTVDVDDLGFVLDEGEKSHRKISEDVSVLVNTQATLIQNARDFVSLSARRVRVRIAMCLIFGLLGLMSLYNAHTPTFVTDQPQQAPVTDQHQHEAGEPASLGSEEEVKPGVKPEPEDDDIAILSEGPLQREQAIKLEGTP